MNDDLKLVLAIAVVALFGFGVLYAALSYQAAYPETYQTTVLNIRSIQHVYDIPESGISQYLLTMGNGSVRYVYIEYQAVNKIVLDRDIRVEYYVNGINGFTITDVVP